jgi:acyl-[acyl-carrier-protein]-phospholipid O-acyltransferase / long-chain-fatty-acid--[acyl-carrier-protein] ligase
MMKTNTDSIVEKPSGIKGRSFWGLMATQALGAVNDNALRMVVAAVIVVKMDLDQAQKVQMLAAVLAIFALPFILFSTLAGHIADRYSKRSVIFWAKIAEILVMLLAALALWRSEAWMALSVVFLMGAQSAFFGPAKYGILPEILPDSELSSGNGLVELFTEMAIIGGCVLGGVLAGLFNGPAMGWIGVCLAGIAVAGTLTSLFVEHLPATAPNSNLRMNFAAEAWRNIREVKRDRSLFLSVLGVSYWWLMASLFQLNFYMFGFDVLGLGELALGLYMALAGVGIGVGAVLAGKLSAGKVEFGLVPIGAAAMTFFSALLYFTGGTGITARVLTASVLFLLGAGSGFFLIPLAAFVQQRAPADGKGTVIAVNNLLSFVGIIAGAILFFFVGTRLDSAQLYLFLSLLTILATGYIFILLPDFLLRFVLWSFTRILYRIQAVDTQNVPAKGGALLVCNHVSYMDALLVLSCLQRFVRFIMYRGFYEKPILRWGCRHLRVIPISESDDPREMIRSLRDAADLVREGELVCIFAEGTITRTGNLLRFQRGFTRIMKGLEAPIIPVYIDRMWGSIFSMQGGGAFNRLPALRRSKVTVAFGSPLPAKSTSAEVRQAVVELGEKTFRDRKSDQVLLHEAFLSSVGSSPGRLCMADTRGKVLTERKTLWSALALADLFKKKLADDGDMVGVMLPATTGSALTNVALLLAGKVPVNLNWTSGETNLRSALMQCAIKTIITNREFLEAAGLKDLDLSGGTASIEDSEKASAETSRGSATPGYLFLEDLPKQITRRARLAAGLKGELLPMSILRSIYGKPQATVDDLATVIFSSGSTGEPKGVMLTHANIMSNVEGINQIFAGGHKARIAGVLPFFHSFGFTATLWLPLIKGMSVVYHSNPADGRAVGAMVREFNCTQLLATPTFLRIYTRAVLPGDFGSLDDVMVGAEKLRREVAEAFFEKFGVRPVEGYGCTECSPVVSINVADFRAPGIMQKGNKPGTIGQPIPGITVRIVDPDDLQPLPVNQEGLLLVRGCSVMKGYLGQPGLTAEVLRGGWYVTGDIARMDEDGFITITDRLSRFSKIGGEMVPHGRIEEELEKILETEDLLVAVAAVPDAKKGEKLVVLHKHLPISVDELYQQLSNSQLPKLWIPRRESFYQIDEIPVLGTGKVDLKGIKTLAAELTA